MRGHTTFPPQVGSREPNKGEKKRIKGETERKRE
jgi:hypothetical protein